MSKHSDVMWHNGKLINWEEGTTHVMSHGLHYGSAVFEGIKCYNGSKGATLFRLKDHIIRLFNSANIHNIAIPFTLEELTKACEEFIIVYKILNSEIEKIKLEFDYLSSSDKLLEFQSLYFENDLVQKKIENIKIFKITNKDKNIENLKIIKDQW